MPRQKGSLTRNCESGQVVIFSVTVGPRAFVSNQLPPVLTLLALRHSLALPPPVILEGFVGFLEEESNDLLALRVQG
jgi:hypothetical protein